MADSPTDDKYIRTFAKDAALLKGEPLPTTDQASVPAEGRDAVLERLRSRATQTPISEAQLLPETLPTPVAIPENKDAPVQIPAPVVARKEQTWKEGDLPTYAPQAPIPNVYREVIPDTTELPNIEPSVVEAQPVPTAPPAPLTEEGPTPLHTYSSDFSDRIDTKTASTFSVIAAQSDAQTGPVAQTKKASTSRRNILITSAGILFLLLALGGAYGGYRYVAQNTFVPDVGTFSSLVFADERVELKGEGGSLQNALLDSLTQPLGDGKVRVFYLTESSTTPASGAFSRILPGGVLLGALQLRAPNILLRNVSPESTVGGVSAGGETRAFFILRVQSYERTFAGMLSWEQTMADELALFYPGYPAPPPPPPTIVTTTKIVKGKRVTATTTVETAVPEAIPPRFIDEVASNHNVRALKDAYGKTILLYGYKDKETLVIARNEAAFAELINRLSATKQQ